LIFTLFRGDPAAMWCAGTSPKIVATDPIIAFRLIRQPALIIETRSPIVSFQRSSGSTLL
jgi:hypothetical protein